MVDSLILTTCIIVLNIFYTKVLDEIFMWLLIILGGRLLVGNLNDMP